jgi:hypothetical protein
MATDAWYNSVSDDVRKNLPSRFAPPYPQEIPIFHAKLIASS